MSECVGMYRRRNRTHVNAVFVMKTVCIVAIACTLCFRTKRDGIRRGDVNLCSIAIIINNINFKHHDEIRVGSIADEDNLKSTLADIGMGVMVCRDVNRKTLHRTLQRGTLYLLIYLVSYFFLTFPTC